MRLIAAYNIVLVETGAFRLEGAIRCGAWLVTLARSVPILSWSGISIGDQWEPFVRALLVSADGERFEVRFDTASETPPVARCHVLGDARAGRLTLVLAADAPERAGEMALPLLVAETGTPAGGAPGVEPVDPGGGFSIVAIRGEIARAGPTIRLLATGTPEHRAPESPPLARGYVAGEFAVSVEGSGA